MLDRFEADPETELVVLVGEIGGDEEEKAARHVAASLYQAGPRLHRRLLGAAREAMGHAGAIISGSSGTAQAKREALEAAGIAVGTTPTELAQLVAERSRAEPARIRLRRRAERLDSSRGHDLVRARRSRARVPAESRSSPTARAPSLERDGKTILSYGPGGRLRAAARADRRAGSRSSRERVMLTNGALQGFVFLAQHFGAGQARPRRGSPTYDRPLKILREIGAEVVPGGDGRRRARSPTRSKRRCGGAPSRPSSTRSRPSRTRAAARCRPSAAAEIVELAQAHGAARSSRTTRTA